LWFIMAEQERGFDEAMDLDEAVWGVMSKVQARRAKEVLRIEGNSIQDLARAFQLKLASEGYDFEVESTGGEVTIIVRTCPWYEILKSSGRMEIAEEIADRICAKEFAGWIREFSPEIEFQILNRLCVESDGCADCRMTFRRVRES